MHDIAVTTDAVVFRVGNAALEVLLIERAHPPFAGHWALPGGFLEAGETLDTCAARELAEETGLANVYLEQLYTFGDPGRDPRGRTVTVAYLGLAAGDGEPLDAASDAAAARWFRVDALPALAFDHDRIIACGIERLRGKLRYAPIALHLLPPQFTLTELQRVYGLILDRELDKRNFRKQIRNHGIIEATGRQQRNGSSRPAMLYRVAVPATGR
ncbi:MAG: NUDIX hydrolase [Gammaproteobacteria bacterium]|nr:NUDIX hydrolase [Gammaproteobacteria bacterium]